MGYMKHKSFSLAILWILLLAGYTMKLHSLHVLSVDGGGAYYFSVWSIGYVSVWLLSILLFTNPLEITEPEGGFPELRESNMSTRSEAHDEISEMEIDPSDDGFKDPFNQNFTHSEDEGTTFPTEEVPSDAHLMPT